MEKEMLELNEQAREEGKTYHEKRFIFPTIEKLIKERVFLGLVGPRGVGKTIILKQILSSTESSFYISLDSTLLKTPLFSIAKELVERGVKNIMFDEVHFYPGFERELKKIYDFLKVDVLFTSSVALSLYESAYDLSRRVRMINVYPFSFREFVYFEKKEMTTPLQFNSILDANKVKEFYGKVIHTEVLFDDYLKGRNYPFTIGKHDYLPLFNNIVETVLTNDLLRTDQVTPEEIIEIRNMLKFIGKSFIEGISYSSIAANVGITKYKAEKYVTLMEKAFILSRIFPKGTNVLREPKITFTLPYRLLYKEFEDCIGALREEFFVDVMKSLGKNFSYIKTNRGEKIPDYLVDDIVIEIGGKGKGRTQFKGIKNKKNIILTQPGVVDEIRRPLFIAGFLNPF